MSDFTQSKQVKTRKEHVCHGCERKYPTGSSMDYVSGVGDGCFFSYYLCKSCNTLIYKHDDLRYWLEEGFIEGAVKQYCEDEGLEIPTVEDGDTHDR